MNLRLLVLFALRNLQQAHLVRLSSDTESAYIFSILYNFRIASHPTITNHAVHWIDPKQLCRWVYMCILLYWAVGMSKFTPFPYRINLSVISLFYLFIFMPIDFRNYTSLSIFSVCKFNHIVILHVLSYHCCFQYDQMTVNLLPIL